MKDTGHQALLEISWRRPLSAEEQARLRELAVEHVEAAGQFQDETALTAALSRLPNPPVASNFTAQVMQAVEQEEARAARGTGLGFNWRSWLVGPAFARRLAFALVVVGLGTLSVHQYALHNRNQVARSVVTLSTAATLPPLELLKDFDAIARLNELSDPALLAALE